MSNFRFLQAEWPELFNEAVRAERLAIADPRTSCFYSRRAVEQALNWVYKVDASLKEPYHRDLSAMINEPSLVGQAGPALRTKMDLIRRQGNLAVHSAAQVHSKDAVRKGYVDYVLWDADGKPLGVVEAKATTTSEIAGQQQAKEYADALEAKFGTRPVIFYTNGYETRIWDDTFYPPRPIQGFYTKDELRSLISRRASRQALNSAVINEEIVQRYYQSRAIRKIGEAFEKGQRHALLVMATGSGKTRTAIALVDVLQKAGWVKRVLFLADRKELVTQATNAFKTHLPGTPVVNLVTEKDDNARVYISTYPTMLNLINNVSDQGHRKFGPGYFDLVIIDEAHRSIFNKYKAIFDYFDALLVGLTATPKNEIDRNTYRVFNLEEGNPTDAYSLDEAMADTYLVGPFTINVPLKIPQLGIKYDDLSDEEKEKWDEVEWDDDDGTPTEVSADEVNKYLFNADTIDKMLQTVMTYGLKVEGGDRLGKTILFARNNKHAEFIVDRFNKIYPEQPGDFARVITYQIKGAEHLIDKFRIKDSAPHIAVSVDMLDTGIDIPEIVNLVFAKLVRSKTKFWQMLGRGTRLCPDLFGPGQDKKQFIIFDVARNVEYFNSDIPEADPKVQPSLGERLFAQRTELLYTLDHLYPELAAQPATPEPTGDAAVRRGVATRLQVEIAGMDRDNIEVRQHLREVDIYLDTDSWKQISAEKRDELKEKLAGLPSAYKDDENSEEAKRFDLIALRLQLGLLVGDPGYEALKMQVQRIAEDLLDPTTLNNPVVSRHAEFLSDVAGEDWWQDITLPMLETMRRTMRGLVRLLPAKRRGVVFTDFQDELGELTPTELKGMDIGTNRSRFERKVRTYLRSHENDLLVQKLMRGRQISSADLDELKNIFLDLGFGTQADIDLVTDEYHGFGLFLRSITGLRRETAVRAFDKFQQGQTFSPAQYSFVELIIESLTKNGFLDIGHLYQQPFKSRAPHGPDTFFTDPEVGTIIEILYYLKQTAIPNDTAEAS